MKTYFCADYSAVIVAKDKTVATIRLLNNLAKRNVFPDMAIHLVEIQPNVEKIYI